MQKNKRHYLHANDVDSYATSFYSLIENLLLFIVGHTTALRLQRKIKNELENVNQKGITL